MDFQHEARQQGSWTIPAGSKVLIELSLIRPKQQNDCPDPFLGESKNGLRSLFIKCLVVAGTYDGHYFYDRIWAPGFLQKIALNEGQEKACARGGTMIRAFLEAANNISPDDASGRAQSCRVIDSFSELNGLRFPVCVGLNPEPVEKNGVVYWNNVLYQVVTPDDPDFRHVMDGGEVLTNGPIICASSREKARAAQNAADETNEPSQGWGTDF